MLTLFAIVGLVVLIANSAAKKTQEGAATANPPTAPEMAAAQTKKKSAVKKKRAATSTEVARSDGLDAQRFEECKAKLRTAQAADMLYNLDLQTGGVAKVMVGPTFFLVPLDTKQGFAETLNCFLMAGASDKHIDFDFLDWRTGKPVGSYSWGRVKMN